jgi:amino acid transporter
MTGQLVATIVFLLLLVFWAWMLRDMANNEAIPPNNKYYWAAAFLFLFVIAAAFYYFTVYRYRH